MACLQLYFSKLGDGHITKKNIQYYVLDEWVGAVLWQFMKIPSELLDSP